MKRRDRIAVVRGGKKSRKVVNGGVDSFLPAKNSRADSPTARGSAMTYEEASRKASRDEGFMATVYAMNTLLIHKGLYTRDEFRNLFVEWVEKEDRKKARAEQPTTHQSIGV